MATILSVAVLASIAVICSFGSPIDLTFFSISIIVRNPIRIEAFSNEYFYWTTIVLMVSITLSIFFTLQIYRYITNLFCYSGDLSEFPVNPMFFPCSTSHTRFFPKKHSFSYSYLLVGIPIGWKGTIGGMISSETEILRRSWFSLKPGGAWYTVQGDDYLGRGHVEGGLKGKLDDYLVSQVCSLPNPRLFSLLIWITGRRPRRLPIRLPAYRGPFSRLLLKSRLNMESLFSHQVPLRPHPRS